MSTTSASQLNPRVGFHAIMHAPRVGRRLRVPVWAVAIAVFWLALLGVFELLEPADSPMPSLCHIKAVTGLPCPTCGTTRAVKAVAAGDVTGAWKMNPFVMSALYAGVLWLVWRFTTGRALAVRLPRAGRVVMWSALGTFFVLNWVYLIWRGV